MSLTVKKTIKECPHGIKLSVNSNHDLKWRHTYRGNSSNDLTEWSGEFGSFLCTSTSFLFWTSLFLRTLINREASATASAVSVEWKVNNSISITSAMVSSYLFHCNWPKIDATRCNQNCKRILVRWNSLSYLIFLTNVSYAYRTITSNFMQLMLILQNCFIFSLYVFMMCVHPIEHKRGEFLLMQYLNYYIENQSFNPLTPKISLVILLTVCHTVLVMLVCRIWY